MIKPVTNEDIIHHDDRLIEVDALIANDAHVSKDQYKTRYEASIKDNHAFWLNETKRLEWYRKPTKAGDYSFDKNNVYIKWFEDGQLNVSVNCIDRHLANRATQTAIIFEDDEGQNIQHITYQELYRQVVMLGNALRAQGVKKGDRVIIYMPMIPEAAYAMLACARIGAVHSVVFGGFSPSALRGRITDCDAKVIITADEGVRGGKKVPLKANVDEAIDGLDIDTVLVVERTKADIGWQDGRDCWYHDTIKEVDAQLCEPEIMDAEDPLFILYTSGSTGKPKGVLHTTAGYLLYTSLTHELVFDYKDKEVYWCTADVGWVTGHSYVVYGPLANGATTLMYEGVPNYPTWSRAWEIVDRHSVSIFYTAPTAIRAQMKEGDEFVTSCKRQSLRILGTVGEPINPEAWNWYHQVVGDGRCPIVDTWWQTETGGHLITPLPGATDLKPGSASKPFFGIEPQIIDSNGQVQEGQAEGALCIATSWPSQMRSVYGDHQRFVDTYFIQYPGKYFTGDGARRDADGYYWITGRMDDVLNVSGHRLGTAEIESALVAHPHVAEAAVVGYPHDTKGQGIYCFVTVNSDVEVSDELKKELIMWVRKEIGPIATPDILQWAGGLPKTRSGKIMRRILRKIAENDYGNLGDTNTLLNPEVVEQLIEGRIS